MIARKDNAELADQFKKNGRLHVPAFLTQSSAEYLYGELSRQSQWNLVWDNAGKNTDMDFQAVERWTEEQKKSLLEIVYKQAAGDFQYLFANIPIYDIYQNDRLQVKFFNQVCEFVNSETFLNQMRKITGFQQIDFSDVQATRYCRGHFLTEHDDNISGKDRLAAYVLNLTPVWNDAWGGALVFHDEKDSASGFSQLIYPCFNALNIFAVPRPHSVSMVSPFAMADRYSLTGWLRTNG
jgi:Rps23 Pro-64 3,4-dihydroxylase Tpa1-like proline 4-hydroxylase